MFAGSNRVYKQDRQPGRLQAGTRTAPGSRQAAGRHQDRTRQPAGSPEKNSAARQDPGSRENVNKSSFLRLSAAFCLFEKRR